MKTHTHKAKTRRIVGFSHCVCVAPRRCDGRAHGGLTEIARCRCGAERRTNVNQGFRERGEWEA